MASKLKGQIAAILKQPLSRINDDVLLSDLVTDSFVLVDMVIELQEELNVLLVQEDLKDVKTVGDLVRVFHERSEAQH